MTKSLALSVACYLYSVPPPPVKQFLVEAAPVGTVCESLRITEVVIKGSAVDVNDSPLRNNSGVS